MILDEILETKREEVGRLRRRRNALEERAADAPSPRGIVRALRARGDVAVIAEFKRRSPSAGSLAEGADPAEVAARYADGGAAALSVLTDGPYFGGSLDDLAAAREATELPVLRKDFLVDPVQILEARAAGADGVLLIARALDGGRLDELLEAAGELGMDALVEVHSEEELERAVTAGARLVGVNARDLTSFAVDLALSERLVGRVPAGRTAVAESGIRGEPDVRRMAAAGADAVLVGGWLMTRGPEAVRELSGVPRRGRRPRVKICGLRRRDEVRAAAEAGADYVGLVFADSPRRVTPSEAGALAGKASEAGLVPVGVFVDRPVEEVRSLASRVVFEVAQLHGDENPEACRQLRHGGLEVWKAVRPRSREELWEAVERYRGAVDALLVEGHSPEAAGGTGTRLPLEWLEDEGSRPLPRLVLAGGLDPDNVAEAVREARPDVVDVSSGVEAAPGEKDPERIRAFVAAVQEAG